MRLTFIRIPFENAEKPRVVAHLLLHAKSKYFTALTEKAAIPI
jgi:hypothetical protein